ncbi:MAG: diaminopimelate decarboxylase [bacterium]|nr:diaminopimelate decarboxylase [bacterium]MBU1918137.1 diaminopimelate decarboxylase [bacterium]
MTKFTHFTYKENSLYCENSSIKEIVENYNTPLYIYSYQSILDQYQLLEEAFNPWKNLLCYAVKANTNKAILKTLFNLGAGADVVSGGELSRALMAGCDPQKIVFSGVGKTEKEIESGIKNNILQFNVESEQELDAINNIAKQLGKKAPIAIRVNPDVDPKTHPYISTGLKKNKFGVNHKQALALYAKASTLNHLSITGISCHIGSQITETQPFYDAMVKIRELIDNLEKQNITLNNIDIGGGMGIPYNQEKIPAAHDYAQAIMTPLDGVKGTIILEPGRFLVGNSAALITKVLYVKPSEEGLLFTIVDSGFNDLMRPMLYQAHHDIIPVTKEATTKDVITNIEGPICESSDRFAKERKIPLQKQNDYLAIMSAGAYGSSMSSTYNSRGRPAEVLVKDNLFFLIKKADQLEDIIKNEVLPDFLN